MPDGLPDHSVIDPVILMRQDVPEAPDLVWIGNLLRQIWRMIPQPDCRPGNDNEAIMNRISGSMIAKPGC